MLIIPSIDLLHGRAVRLLRGQYDAVTDYGEPAHWLCRWKDAGAELVHVVDLAGARDGMPAQLTEIEELAALAIPLQVGGGVRTRNDVIRLRDAGASRVVIGTQAVEQIDLVAELAELYGDGIVVAIDARDGKVRTRGWLEASQLSPANLARDLANLGVRRFLVTDVDRDGTLTEPNFDQLRDVMQAAGRPVIASGGVSSIEALIKLRQAGLEAAVIGRALYDGLMTLQKAQEAANAG